MKKLLLCLVLSGCGYSSTDSEIIGQPKKLVHQTPILCPDRTDLDVSLGIMRNGVGSMSTQDVWLTVPDEGSKAILQDALNRGVLVRIKYDELRFAWCWNFHIVRSVEVLQGDK